MKQIKRMKPNKQYLMRGFALILGILLLLSAFPLWVFAAGETLKISSAEDLQHLADNCVNDTWSTGKNVVLTCDLDLADVEFAPIPLWNGTFDGGGHTISGMHMTDAGSTLGLFRMILPAGTVKNLTVKGIVKPDGTAETVGAVAGINAGTIANCTFDGLVYADSKVGGIAGRNSKGASVLSCTVRGTVNGLNQTGGICGENAGIIDGCHNFAMINTEYRTEVGGIPPKSGEELLGVTDIGGIIGQNDGTVTNCTNEGNVGYPKVGYRVGGISGRQTGLAAGCTNIGFVQGRRDVGGIVGKLVPHTAWNSPENRISELRTQLQKIDTAMDTLLDNIEKAQKETGADMQNVLDSLHKSEQALQTLFAQTELFVNSNIDAANDVMSRLQTAIRGFVPVGQSLAEATASMSAVFASIKEATDAMASAMDSVSPAWQSLSDMLEDVALSMEEAERAAEDLQTAIDRLHGAMGNPDTVKAAMQDFLDGVTDLSAALKSISDRLANADMTPPDGSGGMLHALQAVLDTLRKMGELLGGISNDLVSASIAMGTIADGIGKAAAELDVDAMQEAFAALEKAVAHFGNVPTHLKQAALHLQEAVNSFASAEDDLKTAVNALGKAASAMEKTGNNLQDAVTEATKILEEIGKLPPVKFTTLGSGFVNARKNLFSSLDELHLAMTALSAGLTGNTVAADLQAVSNELFKLLDDVMALLENMDTAKENQKLIRDISTSAEAAYDQGAIRNCLNTARIKGDTYVGGICGTVETEIDLDKENFPGVSSLLLGTAEYTVYAVIESCGSHSDVIAEKQAAGGIVGHMAYGLVENSKTSGEIVSGEAYTGGICGYSEGTVRNCSSRTALYGKTYIGGICGKGKHIAGCLALPYMHDKVEYQGAVAGFADGTVCGNFYTGSRIGGVNGFSFGGRTEEISYDDLLAKAENPGLFASVTVAFITEDGKTVRVEVPYGDTLTAFPEIPEKEHMYWQWDDFDTTVTHDITIKGAYRRNPTTVGTDEDLTKVLVEGEFANGSKLDVTPYIPETLPEKVKDGNILAAYTVKVEGGPDSFIVRVLAEEKGELYVLDGELVKQDYERDGRYIVFTMKNGGSFVYIEKEESFLGWILGGTGGGILLVGLVILLICLHHRKKKKKKAALMKQAAEAEKPETKVAEDDTSTVKKDLQTK